MAGQGLESVAWPVDLFENEKIRKLLEKRKDGKLNL